MDLDILISDNNHNLQLLMEWQKKFQNESQNLKFCRVQLLTEVKQYLNGYGRAVIYSCKTSSEKGVNFIDLRTQELIGIAEGQFKLGQLDGYGRLIDTKK